MRKLFIVEFLTLDGVMQAPGSVERRHGEAAAAGETRGTAACRCAG
jgi:hypothetical protein